MNREIKKIQITKGSKYLEKELKIGFIQTVVDEELAWKEPTSTINMKYIAQKKVWQEINKGFSDLKNESIRPHMIVLPELTVPHGNINNLKNLTKALGAVVIAGMDFELIQNEKIRNRAIILIPQNWPDVSMKAKRVSAIYFGKTFFSRYEEEFFDELGYSPWPDPITYIFDAGKFGKIGAAICSDFFDIERFVIYRGQIHHMIVISHNMDTSSYYFLAEAISRLVYCNVVVCNTGFYGNSLAFSPYDKSYQRIVYRHEGQKLFTTQVVKLPVFELDKAQSGDDIKNIFKSPPPGYMKK